MVCVDPSPEAVLIFLLVHPDLIDKAVELDVCQGLCKAVGNHLVGWNVGKLDSSCSHLVTDVVVLDVDMLRPGMEDRVVCQCD